jgi:alanine racemase
VIGTLRISLGALQRNARALRALVAPSHAAFVVKGNAYGHGLLECALAIEAIAYKLCVFSLDEAVVLRDGGVTAPILVLGPIPPREIDAAAAFDLEVALWDTGDFARLLAAAARKHRRRIKVHVKVNTGLNRLGLEPDDLGDAVEDFLHIADIEIAGIFSHLASAEEIDSPYTMLQLERFNHAYTHAEPFLASHGIAPARHIAASAAAMLWPQTRLDFSRFGIALYGLWPSPQTREAMNGGKLPLEPVMSYETSLAVVRTVAAGTPVGYGTTFHAPREMRIGVLPLGYADGIPRAFSNRGAVIVAGARCGIIGRVAMNMCYVDLTHAPGAQADSKVTLLGRDGDAEISADDWAAWSDTINYEVVTRMPSTLRRDYIEE